jgi:dethiobiotin synthetase
MNSWPNTVAIKPIASGCSLIDGQLISTDAQQLTDQGILSPEQTNPWRFKHPVSPHIAADRAGQVINLDEVLSFCMNFQAPGAKTLLIEGAGGLMVPLTHELTWLDFLIKAQFPVILVVGMKLGCINHALLTYSVLKQNELDCLGWVANCIDPNMDAFEENRDTLLKFIDAPLLKTVVFGG